MVTTVETEIGGKRLILETGLMAKQAGGAVVVRYGDTVVLSTAVSSKVERANVDFLPLTVDYQEKTYAAGRIPGGFFKREGRQTEKEILTSGSSIGRSGRCSPRDTITIRRLSRQCSRSAKRVPWT